MFFNITHGNVAKLSGNYHPKKNKLLVVDFEKIKTKGQTEFEYIQPQ
jgi:hypothetical protein